MHQELQLHQVISHSIINSNIRIVYTASCFLILLIGGNGIPYSYIIYRRDFSVLPDRILFFVLALEKNCEIFIYVVLSFQFSVLNFALIYSLCLLFLYVFIFLLESRSSTARDTIK